MAKIIWQTKASLLFEAYVEEAAVEFGKSTAQRWQKERKNIEWRLERYSVSYPPEELLHNEDIHYVTDAILLSQYRSESPGLVFSYANRLKN